MVCSKMSDILSSTLLDCLEVKTKISYMNQIRKYLPVFKLLKSDFNVSNTRCPKKIVPFFYYFFFLGAQCVESGEVALIATRYS